MVVAFVLKTGPAGVAARTSGARWFVVTNRAKFARELESDLGLTGSEPDYTSLRQTLGLGESTARQTVYRFRDRFRRHLRDEIAETISEKSEGAIDRELEEPRHALRRS